MADIKQTFFQECEEQLAELEAGLLLIEQGEHDSETINAVFRAVHSVKGGAGAFNLTGLVHFAHAFEGAMDLVRTGRLMPGPEVLKVMLRAADHLADHVRAARADETIPLSKSDDLIAELAGLGGASPAVDDSGDLDDFVFVPLAVDLADFGDLVFDTVSTANRFRIAFRPRPELYANGNEPAVLLREIGRLGTMQVTCDLTGLPKLAELDPDGAYLAWTIDLDTEKSEADIREIFEFAECDCTLTVDALTGEPPVLSAATDEMEDDPEPLLPVALEVPTSANVTPFPVIAAPEPRATSPEEAATVHESTAGDRKGAAAAATTIRVDLERVDRLIDLVGELVINQAMLAERVNEAGIARMSAVAIGLDELEQLTREIQDSVMAIRAQPVKSVFQRMPRLAREVAAHTGKSVRLVMEGEGTEVDKTVIERLSDPLTHMIRNAIDHGLEKPAVRSANGKSEEGIVRLSAVHRSGRIVIEVADDGAGIDRNRVRAIAVERNLVAADAKLSDDEIDNLIFLPGFSTAETISDISGRGVGMDVVKQSIQALGGRISISSRPGLGSTFTMSLPLTLAVLDGMVVTVAGQTLVIPLTAVIETLLPKAAAVYGFGDGKRVITLRNEVIPLIDVGEVLSYGASQVESRAGVTLLVEAEGGVRCAMVVDAIQGQRQVVIKSLEENYGHVSGIAAATILGDGRVALILDVDAIVANSRSETSDFDLSLSLAG